MTPSPIFSIGSGILSQCTQDEDGQWWRRDRVGRYRANWGAWYEIDARPESAWYNPEAGKARIVKREAAPPSKPLTEVNDD